MAVTNEYLHEHCRYKIWCEYYGVCDNKRVIAFADNIEDCNFIVGALVKSYAGRPFSFDVELVAEYDATKDELVDDLFVAKPQSK